MNRFTKGVFKFAFLICVYYDKLFKNTFIFKIALEISKLANAEKINKYLRKIMLACVNFRRGNQFSKEFSSLREEFVVYCFFLLYDGKLWKKYDWNEIIEFCHTTYKGLDFSISEKVKFSEERF